MRTAVSTKMIGAVKIAIQPANPDTMNRTWTVVKIKARPTAEMSVLTAVPIGLNVQARKELWT